jgi:hypothetical protein
MVHSALTEDLVRKGHAVTLFASGDSATAAKLIPVCDRAIRLDPTHPDPYALHALMLERVCRHASSFDVIHFHTDGLHLPVARRCPKVTPEKGIECAVEIARRSEIPLKIAAKIDRADQEYFDTRIAGLTDGSLVDFIGEITEVEKTRFLGGAIAMSQGYCEVYELARQQTCPVMS